jgi:CheY-like chemotaxis protein
MRKILLVEDEDILREAYKSIISTEPYELHVASNGEEALALCTQTKFDLILLDLMMPGMDGIDFLEKCSPELCAASKIIVLSNLSSGSELSKAMSLGARKSVVKAELSPSELLALVRYEVEAA